MKPTESKNTARNKRIVQSPSLLNSRFYFWLIAAVTTALLLYSMPLFHLVPLKVAQQKSANTTFNAPTYVDSLWEKLVSETRKNAVDASTLITAIKQNPKLAAEQFGHRLGLGSNAAYFISITGKIISLENDLVIIELTNSSHTNIVIDLGPVFGNAVRDGSGLLNVSDFSNAQDFNDISAEINRRVEESVLPHLREHARLGANLHLTGGIELADDDQLTTLSLIPVHLEWL